MVVLAQLIIVVFSGIFVILYMVVLLFLWAATVIYLRLSFWQSCMISLIVRIRLDLFMVNERLYVHGSFFD